MLFHGAVNPAHIIGRIFYKEYPVMAPVCFSAAHLNIQKNEGGTRMCLWAHAFLE